MQQTNINGSIVHSSRNFDSAKEYPIIHQSIFTQYQALRDRTVSAVELCEQYLDYVRDVNPRIHAFIALDEKRAIEAAKVADTQLAAGIDLGILHGIPFAVKDLIFVDGFATQCGSKQPQSAQPQAVIIDALERAGAICLGKLATYEYATVGPAFDLPYEIVRNPVNPDHVTGGSSSGSAAAVAARMLRFAIGTDTGGSIRSPAAYCGVVGLKPTFGALSAKGIVPLAPTMDVPGIMAASALEAWIAFSLMRQNTRLDDSAATQKWAVAHSLKGKKIGYARDFFAHDPKLDPEILEAMDHAASVFSLLGADITEIDLPDYQPLEDAAAVILHIEAYDYHAPSLKAQPESYGNLAYNSLLYGNQFQQADLLAANLVRERFKSELAKVFNDGKYDAILTVNTLTAAAEIAKCNNEKPVWSPMRTIPFNLTGNPVLAMPAGFTSQGLPIGLQLIGEVFAEEKLCQIGSAYETQAVGFWKADVAHGFGVV